MRNCFTDKKNTTENYTERDRDKHLHSKSVVVRKLFMVRM